MASSGMADESSGTGKPSFWAGLFRRKDVRVESAWGIDLGDSALKAVQLARDGSQLRVQDLEIVPHERPLSQCGDEREAAVQAILSAFVDRHPMRGQGVAVGIAAREALSVSIKLPPLAPDRIADVVRFKAGQQFSLPLAQLDWTYQLFRGAKSIGADASLFALPEGIVAQQRKIFDDADIKGAVLQLNSVAAFNAMLRDAKIKERTLIIDMGAAGTDLIVADSSSVWLGAVAIGGNHFTKALMKSFALDFAQAEELKRQGATGGQARQVLAAVGPVLTKWVAEIRRSLDVYKTANRNSEIAAVLVLGGAAQLPGLIRYMQQHLHPAVTCPDALAVGLQSDPAIASDWTDHSLRLASAYGLALQAMSEAKIDCSFP